jgi:hypothetical protein
MKISVHFDAFANNPEGLKLAQEFYGTVVVLMRNANADRNHDLARTALIRYFDGVERMLPKLPQD